MFVDYVLSTFLVQNNTAKYSKEQLGALPFQTCDMKREGAGPPVNVDVACQAPSDHLQIVESHNPLQEVIPVLIVNLKDIFRSETNIYMQEYTNTYERNTRSARSQSFETNFSKKA